MKRDRRNSLVVKLMDEWLTTHADRGFSTAPRLLPYCDSHYDYEVGLGVWNGSLSLPILVLPPKLCLLTVGSGMSVETFANTNALVPGAPSFRYSVGI